MKLNKLLLVSLLSGGLLLSACSQRDNNEEPGESFKGQVAGYSFSFVDYYVIAIEGELFPEAIANAEQEKQKYIGSTLKFNKDMTCLLDAGKRYIEGIFSQNDNSIKLLISIISDGEEVHEYTLEQAEQMPLMMTIHGEKIDIILGSAGGGSSQMGTYVHQYHANYTLIK